jgi:hypothetical protein
MRVFINEREVADVTAGREAIGEVIEALAVHVDPSEIVVEVALDGVVFSAGDSAGYAARPAAGVDRLALITRSIPALVDELREEVRHALAHITAKFEAAVSGFARGESSAAHHVLAAALEELHLALVLDQRTVQLAGVPALTAEDQIAPLAEALLAAQSRRNVAETSALIGERLVPLLRTWSAAAAAPAIARAPASLG